MEILVKRNTRCVVRACDGRCDVAGGVTLARFRFDVEAELAIAAAGQAAVVPDLDRNQGAAPRLMIVEVGRTNLVPWAGGNTLGCFEERITVSNTRSIEAEVVGYVEKATPDRIARQTCFRLFTERSALWLCDRGVAVLPWAATVVVTPELA